MAVPRRVIAKQIGDLLVERKMITPAQFQAASKIQQEKGGLLGQILVSLGVATEDAIAQALTSQYGFPYLPLKNYAIEQDLIRLVPENVARQYCLIPVDRIGDTLTVAMADPLNARAVEDIEMLSRCSVQVFVATMSDVAEAILRHYGENHAGG